MLRHSAVRWCFVHAGVVGVVETVLLESLCACCDLEINNNKVHLSCTHQRPERSHDTY